jgi:hypothetical protein
MGAQANNSQTRPKFGASVVVRLCCVVLLILASGTLPISAQPATPDARSGAGGARSGAVTPGARSPTAGVGARPLSPAQPTKARVSSTVTNPHLRGTATTKPALKRGAKSSSALKPRWNYNSWAAQHLGTGTIEGFVRDNRGEGLNQVRLALRGPKGRVFRNIAFRHITFTNPSGHFVMRYVKARAYRIVAMSPDRKKRTHLQINLDAGAHLRFVMMMPV